MSNDDQPNPSERWLPVVGHEGRYEVSSVGRVRSLLTNRILSPGSWTTHGYKGVQLYTAGKAHPSYVHVLVLRAFSGERPFDGAVARHLNGNSTDNRVENLRWGTQVENMQDRARHGNEYWSNQTHCKHGHPFAGDNVRFHSGGRRVCRACQRQAKRDSRRRAAERALVVSK